MDEIALRTASDKKLKMFPLRYYGFSSPFWVNETRYGVFPSVVQEGGKVDLKGVTLHLPETAPLAGTPVMVWLSVYTGNYVCAVQEDIDRFEAEIAAARKADEEAYRQRLNNYRAEAVAFNNRIKLPVTWTVDIKDVLSGLTQNSQGDGRRKSTVNHIMLLEPLAAGRIKREKGDFLCTARSGSNGMRYVTDTPRAIDGDGMRYMPQVTCKACLALAKRWMSE